MICRCAFGDCCKKFIRSGDCSIVQRAEEKKPSAEFRKEYKKVYGLSDAGFNAKFPDFDDKGYVHRHCFNEYMAGEKEEDGRTQNTTGTNAMLNRRKTKRGRKAKGVGDKANAIGAGFRI